MGKLILYCFLAAMTVAILIGIQQDYGWTPFVVPVVAVAGLIGVVWSVQGVR